MSSGNMLKKKKAIQLPHIYVLQLALIVVCTNLTWVNTLRRIRAEVVLNECLTGWDTA